MAKKNSRIVRVDEETYKELTKMQKQTNENMAKVVRRYIKACKGRKEKYEIEF